MRGRDDRGGGFRQLFDLFSETTVIAAKAAADGGAISAKSEIWLGFLDTYRTMCIAPDEQMRSVFEGLRGFSIAA